MKRLAFILLWFIPYLSNAQIKEMDLFTLLNQFYTSLPCTHCNKTFTSTLDVISYKSNVPPCKIRSPFPTPCFDCKIGIMVFYIELPVSHVIDNYHQYLIPATCSVASYYDHVCSLCGDHFPEYQGEPLGHIWGDPFGSDTTPATCTEHGGQQHTCSRCDITEYLPALGHDWGDWYISTLPTCTKYGRISRECTRCGEIESFSDERVAATGHQYTNHRCTVCNEWEAYSQYYIEVYASFG